MSSSVVLTKRLRAETPDDKYSRQYRDAVSDKCLRENVCTNSRSGGIKSQNAEGGNFLESSVGHDKSLLISFMQQGSFRFLYSFGPLFSCSYLHLHFEREHFLIANYLCVCVFVYLCVCVCSFVFIRLVRLINIAFQL